MRSRTLRALVPLATIPLAGAGPAGETRTYVWSADPAHSSIVFETAHWGIVDIVGWFERYDVTVRSRALDFGDAVFEVRIDPTSVRMPNSEMASNLRELFFEVETFPEIRFRSTRIEPSGEGMLRITGDLTMKAVTREVELAATFRGYGSPPQGNPGFRIETELDRTDFGVGDLQFLDGTGHPLVDPNVRITANLRLDYVRSEFSSSGE